MRKKKKRKWNLKSRVIPKLRRIFFYSPLRREAIEKAKGKCALCKKKKEKLVVDHIEPVVGTKDGWIDWNTYIGRLFCSLERLQCLCEKCHKKKCDVERKERMSAKARQAHDKKKNDA